MMFADMDEKKIILFDPFNKLIRQRMG